MAVASQTVTVAVSITRPGNYRDAALAIQSFANKMGANLHQRLKRLEARVKPTDEPEEFVAGRQAGSSPTYLS